mmetsp:Transcript_53054/g.126225  ORF Transcript_53054/g.126225 Transcript_53054/m.126225 type:complete len:220 (-) Transcript_53054:169-828(-)
MGAPRALRDPPREGVGVGGVGAPTGHPRGIAVQGGEGSVAGASGRVGTGSSIRARRGEALWGRRGSRRHPSSIRGAVRGHLPRSSPHLPPPPLRPRLGLVRAGPIPAGPSDCDTEQVDAPQGGVASPAKAPGGKCTSGDRQGGEHGGRETRARHPRRPEPTGCADAGGSAPAAHHPSLGNPRAREEGGEGQGKQAVGSTPPAVLLLTTRYPEPFDDALS